MWRCTATLIPLNSVQDTHVRSGSLSVSQGVDRGQLLAFQYEPERGLGLDTRGRLVVGAPDLGACCRGRWPR